MASTVTAATLQVLVAETITLNGIEYGGSNVLKIGSINECSKRIVTASTTKTEILSIGSSTSKGGFIAGDLRYMRFTNLDDTNHIVLFFTNENHDEFAVKLDKGQSFIFNSDLSGGGVDTLDANFGGEATASGLGDLTKVSIQSDTASCDVEYFVAST
mgnify:CR=1 FL=1|tara:strand:+ start:744 stop:1217 length:474 start_codon:yes stop_codon:yes gene_type:complete